MQINNQNIPIKSASSLIAIPPKIDKPTGPSEAIVNPSAASPPIMIASSPIIL